MLRNGKDFIGDMAEVENPKSPKSIVGTLALSSNRPKEEDPVYIEYTEINWFNIELLACQLWMVFRTEDPEKLWKRINEYEEPINAIQVHGVSDEEIEAMGIPKNPLSSFIDIRKYPVWFYAFYANMMEMSTVLSILEMTDEYWTEQKIAQLPCHYMFWQMLFHKRENDNENTNAE